MSDLISRQAAIRAYCEHECGKGMIRGECGCDDCGTIFDGMPSAQPEIIRCKDCKHSFLHNNGERISRICGRTKMCGTTKDNWFCADGERRTDE